MQAAQGGSEAREEAAVSQVRDLDETVTVTVFCCDHCHGEPEDCPDRKSAAHQEQIDDEEAMVLLHRSHRVLSGQQSEFERVALIGDLRLFILRVEPMTVLL